MVYTTSAAGIALIKRFEGCKLVAYQDVAGIWTIGYGHTRTAKAGMRIGDPEADALLKYTGNAMIIGEF
jgi:lysozyme